MGAGNFHNLLPASWTARKASGIVQRSKSWRAVCRCQSELEVLKTRNTKADQQPSSTGLAESEYSLPLPFCYIQALNALDGVHHLRAICLLSSPIQMLSFSRNTLTDISRNV